MPFIFEVLFFFETPLDFQDDSLEDRQYSGSDTDNGKRPNTAHDAHAMAPWRGGERYKGFRAS